MSVRETLPFPPDDYMALVFGELPDRRNYFSEGGIWSVNMLDEQKLLGADIRLLDIGCGCGRVARALALLEKPLASYQGFDRHRGMIDWCRQEITSRFPKFIFSYFDIKSAYQLVDQQDGKISATEFRFPFDNSSFDSIILFSVFTHMPMIEIYNYISEIQRVLTPRGKVLLTVFFSEGDEDEVKSEGFDFHLSKGRFLNALEQSNFHYKFIATHAAQNFYVLRPLSIDLSASPLPKTLPTERHQKLRDLLIARRKEAGLTQTVLAQRLGKLPSDVAKYELGERRIDVLEYLDIAAAIGFDPAELIRSLETG